MNRTLLASYAYEGTTRRRARFNALSNLRCVHVQERDGIRYFDHYSFIIFVYILRSYYGTCRVKSKSPGKKSFGKQSPGTCSGRKARDRFRFGNETNTSEVEIPGQKVVRQEIPGNAHELLLLLSIDPGDSGAVRLRTRGFRPIVFSI